ncbi:MAG: DUF47 family protein [Prevotellaceae bacterium]|jgi:predicted phosphate transport protein (TIGR00153 family)|nr:DUF47 family protein [Prevotellaceae bacterium]
MKSNTFFSKLVPKESKFYPILRSMSDNIFVCSGLMLSLVQTEDKEQRKELYRQIKALETKGDAIVGHLFDELNNTFITPFDREDINALGEQLDNVLDSMNSAAKRIVMYQPSVLPPQTVALAEVLQQCCELLLGLVGELNAMKKNPTVVKRICKQLHALENQADDLYEHILIDIFAKETNAIDLIRIKEVVQEIERATDNADSVGKLIKVIVVKYA